MFFSFYVREKLVGPAKCFRTSRSLVLLVLRGQYHFELALRPAISIGFWSFDMKVHAGHRDMLPVLVRANCLDVGMGKY